MDLREAQTLAWRLMCELGVSRDWIFRFDRAKKRFGLCSFRRRTISLSAYLTQMNTLAEVEDTIRHEIAHVLVGPRQGHNRHWRAMAKKCGARPVRCYDSSKIAAPSGKYYLRCTLCGHVFTMHRLTKAAKQLRAGKHVPYWHSKCGRAGQLEYLKVKP